VEPGVLSDVLLTTLGVIVGCMLILWVISLSIADVSIVDIFWGPGFAIVAWTSHAVGDGYAARAWLVCVLVSLWALRLASHLARRNLGRGEDYRYRSMRAHHGARFPIVSLGTVFLLQAVLLWLVSWPLQAVHGPRATAELGWLDVAGVLLWGAGLAFETTADAQLARFKRAPDSKGRVMDRGLWRYSRHPNYFGDCLLWWGFGLFGLAAGGPWSLIGSAMMTVLLVKVSGVALLESTITERRPGYRAYMQRTSAFVPWPPKDGVKT
jgi:steroid 5-alpha reductase family enzyme